MADNITLDAGSGGATIKTDDDGTAHWQYVKLAHGADNTQTRVTASAGLPVTPDSGGFTVTANLGATDNAVLDAIAASLVDVETNTDFGAVTGGGTETGALRVTIANNSSGVMSVDDNGGALTVDNGGTFAVQVDGAALTALQLIDDVVYVDDADWTATSSKHALVGGVYQSSPGTITDGDTGPLRLTANGAAHVAVQGTVTVDLGANNDVTLATLPDTSGGDLAAINTATAAIQTAVETLDNAISGSEMQVDVVGSLPAGTNAIGKLAANSGVDIGDVDVTSVPRGTSHYRNIDANAEAEIKGSAGTLFWLHVMNLTNAKAYLHLYDATAASVTPGTTTPTFTFAIPTQGDTNGAGFTLPFNGGGHAFANGITLVCTTTLDGSAGDPGTNGVIVNAGYA